MNGRTGGRADRRTGGQAAEASGAMSGRGSPVFWFLLLVAGQAATLVLSQSGRDVTYQHYELARLLDTWPHLLALGVLLLQTVVVVRGLSGSFGHIWRWLRENYRMWALLAGGGVLLMMAAAPSSEPLLYVSELVFAAFLQLVALGTAVVFVRSIDDAQIATIERRLTGMGGRADAQTGGRAPFAWWLALGVTVVCAFLAAVVYERVPHLPDEIVYLLHATYFADGLLQLPVPPVPAAFDVDLMYYDETRFFSPVPPGWPAILAIGVKLGVPWLVNPVLSGVCVILLHAVLRRIGSPRTARLGSLLLATSPWFLFLGMSMMTHTSTLALALAGALGIAEARARSAVWPAALAGVATGFVSLIRPLEGLAVAVVLGLWSLSARSPVFRLLPSVALTVVTVAVGSVARVYNAALTGNPSRFPIMMYSDKYFAAGANDLGFGPSRGMGWGGLDPFPGHGARDVLVNSLLNGSALNLELFGWACGSLLLIVGVIFSGRLRRTDWAMVGIIALIVGLHALYWFSGGPDFGARYWYLVIVPCVVLAARAPSVLFGSGTPNAARTNVMMLALSVSALLTFVPWRSLDKYSRYRAMGGQMRAFAREHDLGRALVLVRGRRHPDYHQAALENPLDLGSDATIYVWDRTSTIRRAAVGAYSDRPVYIVDGPTITENGFRIVAGPLPPGSIAGELPSSADIPKVVGDRANDGVQRRAP